MFPKVDIGEYERGTNKLRTDYEHEGEILPRWIEPLLRAIGHQAIR